MNADIRWHQRFSNYRKALSQIREAGELSKQRELSNLEKQGLIHAYKYTHELAWKTLKDFLKYRGSTEQIFGSKDATREAFNNNLIANGEIWMQMIQSRNLTSHTYNEEQVEEIVELILKQYISEFETLNKTLQTIKNDELSDQ